MRGNNLINFFVFILFSNLFFLDLYPQINNSIVVKVGNSLITTVDIENEITTNLIINNQKITQVNIDNNKNYAIKNLIAKTIKRSEINKYKIENYNKKDLKDYIENIAKNLNTNQNGLKEIFKKTNIDYQIFVEKHKTELLWNTLIFKLYVNQTNVNIVEVDNEVEIIKKNKSKDEINKIKKDILNKKKREKLSLFSRSHLTNLENSVVVNFQ